MYALKTIYPYVIALAALAFVLALATRTEAAPHGKPATPAELIRAGLVKHRHKSAHRCMVHGVWVPGCK